MMGIFTNVPKKEPSVFINEAYFVDNPNIIKMQNLISKIRKESTALNISKFNTNPTVLEFNRLVEKEFGFDTFCLYVSPSRYYDTRTFPVSSKLDTANQSQKIKKRSNGFYYNENDYAVITYISSSLILDNRFTDREILAIILHEIGHSFTGAIPGIGLLTNLIRTIRAVHMIELLVITILMTAVNPILGFVGAVAFMGIASINMNKLHGPIIRAIEERRKSNKELEESITFVKDIFDTFKYTFSEITILNAFIGAILNPAGVLLFQLGKMFNKIVELAVNPFGVIENILGYQQEKISDNFATMYGYGGDLSSALIKFKKYNGGSAVVSSMQETTIFKILFDLMALPHQVLFAPFHVHPETAARVKDQLKYLQKELNSGSIDPKMKKRIESDIKEIEDLIDENYKSIKLKMKDSSVDPDIVSKMYPVIMYNLFGGDIREIFMSKGNWEKINRVQ